jgi:general stress protein 26
MRNTDTPTAVRRMATDRPATIKKVAKLMRDLDFCMLTTRSNDGLLHARPMSNNGEVEFDGDVWFFSAADTRKVEEIEADSSVHLSYADVENFRFISMSGEAEIVRDLGKKQELWVEDLERWFTEGPEDEDVVLIKVSPTVIEYWDGEEEGKLTLD